MPEGESTGVRLKAEGRVVRVESSGFAVVLVHELTDMNNSFEA